MEQSDKESAKLIGALIAGAAIGAAIGILFAPDKGSETRKKFMDNAGGLADTFKDILSKATGMAEGKESEPAEGNA